MALVRATVLSVLLLQTSAQLLSCSQIDCPLSHNQAQCEIGNTTLSQLGVANLTSSLSTYPLTWTIGLSDPLSGNGTARRHYYLGTPKSLDLNTRTDAQGCALFFTGIESGLKFSYADLLPEDPWVDGTCADALGSRCISDLTKQAHDLVVNLTASSSLQCSSIADALLNSPPASCTEAGTWVTIVAQSITGPDSPSPLQLSSCNPTSNTTYNMRSIAALPSIGTLYQISYITPVMTIFAAAGNATGSFSGPELHLNCMKALSESPSNATAIANDGVRLAQSLLPFALGAIAVSIATAVLTI